jgi:hypothetical protein
MKRRVWLLAGAIGMVPAAALADTVVSPQVDTTPTINVGQNVLLPNQAGQQITLFVTGGMAVDGETLAVQVDNGPAPTLTGVDIVHNTIFSSNNNGQITLQSNPHADEVFTHTQSSGSSVSAEGQLVHLTFDTTGTPVGIYTLDLTGTQFGNTTFTTPTPPTDTVVNPHVTNGNVIVAIPGDANLSGKVDFADLVILAANYGHSGTFTSGDFNGDGVVNFKDLVILAAHYGQEVTPVPVPVAAASGAGLLGLLLLQRYRKSRKTLV